MKKHIFLAYRTDVWHSSKELVFIGDSLQKTISQLIMYEEMTKEDAKQIKEWMQTQGNNRDYEWFVEKQNINDFVE